MNEISCRRAEKEDIDTLVAMRIAQLQEEGEEPTFDLAPMLREYYAIHFADGSFAAWLALAEGEIIASSGMSFIEKPPYYNNPSGKIGLLNSVYTQKEYRRRGIARMLLDKVVGEAVQNGCGTVQLTASDAGVYLYLDYGFRKNGNFMQYNLRDITKEYLFLSERG